MAQTITRSISIDVAQENRLQPIVAKQYDRASRFLNVQFLDMGTEMTIEQGATIVINAKRSDGQGLSFSGSVNSDGTVRVPITYWMLELDGPVVCDISIITGSSADTMLTSTSFTLEVQAAAVTNADVEENEDYPVLLELIHEVSEFEPELLDIRNGVHGQTFNSAGDAVRASADQLYNMKTGFDGVTYDSPAAMVRGSDTLLRNMIGLFGNFGKYTVAAGNYNIQFSFIKGHAYIVTNLSPNQLSFSLRETSGGSNVQSVYGLNENTTVTFVANQDAAYVGGWNSSAHDFIIIDYSSKLHGYDIHEEYITQLSKGQAPVVFAQGGYLTSTADVIAFNQYYSYSNYVDCSNCSRIRTIASNVLNYSFWYSADKTQSKSVTIPAGDNILEVPDGYPLLRISGQTGNAANFSMFMLDSIYDNIEAIGNNNEATNEGFLISNDVTSLYWIQGTFNETDVDSASNYFIRSNYCHIENLKSLSYIISSGYYMMWHIYDKDKNRLSIQRSWQGNDEIFFPDNAAYVRLLITSQNQVHPSDASSIVTLFGKNKIGLSIPDYWLPVIEAKIQTIQDLQKTCGTRGDSFVYITDYHDDFLGRYNSNNSPDIIQRIMEYTSARMVVFGGDAFNKASNLEDFRKGLYGFYNRFNWLKEDQFFPVIGNHEFYSNIDGDPEDAMTAEEAYVLNYRRYEHSFSATDYLKTYCFDNVAQKIRYFCIGCDYDSEISDDQVAWLLNQFGEIPEGYKVLCFSHAGTYNSQTDPYEQLIIESMQKILDGLDALKTGASVTIDDVTYDYSDKARDVICVICGHNHRDMYSFTTEDIPVVTRAADTIDANAVLAHTKGTTTELAFDVVNLDFTNRKIYFTRIGAGNSSDFSF